MRTTNFENNLRTIRLAVQQGYDTEVQIKKLNTGSYVYFVSAVNTPGMKIYYTVSKYSKTGKNLGKVTVDATNYGMSYNNKAFSIPDSIDKVILDFNRSI